MKKILLLLLLFSIVSFSQEKNTTSNNPIIYADMTLGFSLMNTYSGIGTINYQTKNNLFTYRFSELYHITAKDKKWLIVFPFLIFSSALKSREHAFLYGKRYENNDFSYSFSGGLSYTRYTDNPSLLNPTSLKNSFFGFPFEVNVKWFKSEKKRFRIYSLIPVGKPTGLGGSFGIKLFGNISKKSYIGIGLTFGLGYYKNYN